MFECWKLKRITSKYRLDVRVCGLGCGAIILYCVLFFRPYVAYQHRDSIITSLDYKYLINPNNTCGHSKDPFLLILITSFHPNVKQRESIRSTWGSVVKTGTWPKKEVGKLTDTVKLVFMFGRHDDENWNEKLIEEAAKYGDILQTDFKESYRNLTLKVLTGLTWMKQECPNAKRIMKIDEDTFPNIPMLLRDLHSIGENTVYGYCISYSLAMRFTKYSVSFWEYPYLFYPTYCTGNLYVLPNSLAKRVHTLAKYYPPLPMEDVHITGLLSLSTKADHHDVGKNMYDPRNPPTVCDFVRDRKLYGKDVYTDLAVAIWKNLETGDCVESGM